MNEGLGLTAADVAAVTRNDDDNGWGCNSWIWIIFLAFLFPMFGGMWGNRNGVETGVQDNFISDEFVKRDIFNTDTQTSLAYRTLEVRYRLATAIRRKKCSRTVTMRR